MDENALLMPEVRDLFEIMERQHIKLCRPPLKHTRLLQQKTTQRDTLSLPNIVTSDCRAYDKSISYQFIYEQKSGVGQAEPAGFIEKQLVGCKRPTWESIYTALTSS